MKLFDRLKGFFKPDSVDDVVEVEGIESEVSGEVEEKGYKGHIFYCKICDKYESNYKDEVRKHITRDHKSTWKGSRRSANPKRKSKIRVPLSHFVGKEYNK